jgi:4-hydroxy-4-methyl-2-oxoglutarate aldolase
LLTWRQGADNRMARFRPVPRSAPVRRIVEAPDRATFEAHAQGKQEIGPRARARRFSRFRRLPSCSWIPPDSRQRILGYRKRRSRQGETPVRPPGQATQMRNSRCPRTPLTAKPHPAARLTEQLFSALTCRGTLERDLPVRVRSSETQVTSRILSGVGPLRSLRRAYRGAMPSVEGLKTADFVDAMGRLHRHRCHLLDLVSPTPGRVLFGPAVTISYFPSCSAALDPGRYNLANLFYEAVGDESEGKVVVLASNGYTDASMGGGTKLSRLQQHGCAGVLTDGRLRDFDELAAYDFAAYCSGEATKWGGGEVTPFQANVPVVLSGVGVVPGQYVFADNSGAVVIPDKQIEDVVAGARAVEAEDDRYREEIGREQVRRAQ